MGIQSNVNQALAIGSAGIAGVKHLQDEKIRNGIEAAKAKNEIEEKGNALLEEVENTKFEDKDPTLDNDVQTMQGLAQQYNELKGKGIEEVNPLGANQFVEKYNIAQKELSDRITARNLQIDAFAKRVEKLKGKANMLNRTANSYNPIIKRGGIK